MVEKPIKVDEHTDRLVTDLAYFLRCSKKSIVREAVADFAETRLPKSRPAPGGVGEYAPGGVGEGEEKGQRVRRDEALEDGALEDGVYEQGVFTGDRDQGRGSSRTGGVTFDALESFDRLALRRTELLRQFAQHGGTNVRVLERVDESTTDEIVLLADTDPVAGSAAIPVLEEIAYRLLRTRATVVSMTALRMFGSGRLQPALAQSRPL